MHVSSRDYAYFFSSLAQSIADNPEAGEIRNLPGILVLDGGVIIQAEGSMVGAVGVAGAPGGKMRNVPMPVLKLYGKHWIFCKQKINQWGACSIGFENSCLLSI